ncbi:MAG TPA: GMC family oxidoreductase, partial [Vicinamibacterales bacterium]
TIENGLADIYRDPRVTLRLDTEVVAVETSAGRANGLIGLTETWKADLVVLGAGAIFNAAILQRSGIEHPLLGRRLHEQVSLSAVVELDGLDGFDGSTVITGHGYMLYDGPHRRERGACLIETWNRPDQLRWEPGRERQLLQIKCIVEDLPQERNRVTVDSDGVPVLEFHDYSAYARRTLDALPSLVEDVLSCLPVERVLWEPEPAPTEGHILGTVVMGDDPERSIVDRWLLHHRLRNLAVLGGSAFPTASPAHPTLMISALALRTAAYLMGRV